MSYTRTESFTMIEMVCWCGTPYATTDVLHREYRDRTLKQLYCPLGHSMVPLGKTHEQMEREKRLRAEARLAQEQDSHEMTRRRLAAAKGQATKLRNRIKNGVCPWCNRHFENVKRHVASKHPEHLHTVEEVSP